MMSSVSGQWALRYVERYGWSPIPLWTATECAAGDCPQRDACPPNSHGKHPRVQWQEPYLPDPVTIEQAADWWNRWPHAGVAILTGRRSGIDVIDIDPKNGGSLETLRDTWPDLPDTYTVETGSGGGHIYITSPDVPTSHNLAKHIAVAGVDYRGDGGLVVAPPTTHHTGRIYHFLTTPPTAWPTPTWLNELAHRRHQQQRDRDEKAAKLARHLATNPPTPLTGNATDTGRNMTKVAVGKIADSTANKGKPGGRHDTVLDQAFWLGGLIPTNHLTAAYITDQLHDVAIAVTSGEHREAEMAEAIRWGIEHGQCKPWEPEDNTHDVTQPRHVPPPTPSRPNERLEATRAAIAAARAYQDIPDPTHIITTLAVALTRDADDDPVWLLQVAAPSSGKTETIKGLSDQVDAHLDDVTAAGLLSYRAGKRAGATGILTNIAGNALATFGDLSSLLATSDRGGRDTTFALLRRVYDGHVTRNLGNAPQTLEWKGRLTVVAAVTGIIDNYTAHNDALGPRWIYIRIPPAGPDSRRQRAKLSIDGAIDSYRSSYRQAVNNALTLARSHLPDRLPAVVATGIIDAAIVTCFGRASVPRHGYGKREIDGLPIIEEPPRLVRQLAGLARGLLALGLDDELVTDIARRVALDSMPAARRGVLEVVATGEVLTTAGVARAADMNRDIARRRLEELEATGVVSSHRDGADPSDDEPDRRPVEWRIDGDYAPTIVEVFAANVRSGNARSGCRKVFVTHTPPPQEREEIA